MNNHYGMGGQTAGETMGFDIAARVGAGINPSQMHAERVDGYNPLAVADATLRCKNKLIKGIEAFKIVSLNKKIIQSNSEARRLIRGGAVKFNGKIIADETKILFKKDFKENKIEVSVGKKNHFAIKII